MSTSAVASEAAAEPLAGSDCLRVRGARTHNLQAVDVDIPRDRLVVITGPSGSGKSSLAFDTIFAEGQRQFIESLSVSARQWIDQMERPDVDLIEGLQPTLCVDQRPGNRNPRSTVATATEIYDYLRLLFARLGTPHCLDCGAAIDQRTEEQVVERLLRLPEGTKTLLLAPLLRGGHGNGEDALLRIRKAGLVRARIDGEVVELEQLGGVDARRFRDVEAVVDRVTIRSGIQPRLVESVKLAVRLADGRMIACWQDGESRGGVWRDEWFSTVYACPTCNLTCEELEPRTFSFNSPYGACPQCDGLGTREEFDADLVVPDRETSLAKDAVASWKGQPAAAAAARRAQIEPFLRTQGLAWDDPLSRLDAEGWLGLLHGHQGLQFPGLLTLLEQEFATTTRSTRLEQLKQFRGDVVCRACGGARLQPVARTVTFGGRTMHDLARMSIAEAARFLREVPLDAQHQPVAEPLLRELLRRLTFLDQVGVGYLTLGRASDTLSGGELQRVRLATGIGTGLVGVCYVLDEPTVGLHPRDNRRLLDAIRGLQQAGNTVLVVEHDEAVMREADWIIDMGPGAGRRGGRVVAQGVASDLPPDGESTTGKYLAGTLRMPVRAERRRAVRSRSIMLEGATLNNLRDVEAWFPLGCLVCVTGVSGSGKSSLVNDTLAPAVRRRLGLAAAKPGPFRSLRGVSQLDHAEVIDQAPLGLSSRSNAATYTGVFDEVRKVFAATRDAKQRGFRASRFSFNAKGGRCEACQGHGVKKIEMSFLPDLYVVCGECQGQRFNNQTLQVRYADRSIADVLNLAVDEAADFFQNFAAIHGPLRALQDVGLGYLPLGQPATSLSGGEAQRIKLATQLAGDHLRKTLFIMDEPTTGLHFDDVARLLEVLHRLVDRGHTVIVIEHNLDVIQCADWIIDLGPEGGAGGGSILASGTPEQLARQEESVTGRYLASMRAIAS